MFPTAVASIEMAYARMREQQDLANRSRAQRPAAAQRAEKRHVPRHKKR
ncbi:hypothetical protein OG233_13015 [Streptomyces sp. NBC_01218]|nr:hypothetical protein OG233_13015 [Streptomyces sp. NBC_01218]